ncbi:MAG: hypothetical protein KAI89_05940, partial [Emcibacter sp.]|nr:hypothetical protein [Emcibacter sp.]
VANQPFSGVHYGGSLKQVGDKMVIKSADGDFWIFDGTDFSQPTLPVELGGGSLAAELFDATEVDGLIYFTLGADNSNVQVIYDGTNFTTLSDPYGNTASSDIDILFEDSLGNVIFSGSDGVTDALIFSSDGTTITPLTGTDLDILTKANIYTFTEYQGSTYFYVIPPGESSVRLYKFDGTNVSPASDTEASPTLGGNTLFVFDGKLYFNSFNSFTGSQAWSFDGTNYAEFDFNGLSSSISNPALFNGNMIFSGSGASGEGVEFWVYDGTNSPTMFDLNAGSSSSSPRDFTVIGDKLYFSATGAGNDRELWVYDGTNAPTMINVRASGSASPAILFEFQGDVYFKAWTSFDGNQLFKYNETDGSTQITSVAVQSPHAVLPVGDTVYFIKRTDATGYELWSYDGTNAPTLAFDSTPGIYGMSSGAQLFEMGGQLVVFTGDSIFSWDGANATILMTGNISEVSQYGNQLFILAEGDLGDGTFSGQELWVTDGTTAATLVDDLNTQPGGPAVFDIVTDPFVDPDTTGLTLNGGNGDDVLVSGATNDTMTGGLGDDVFVFDNNWGDDIITDYEDGIDLIDFSDSGLVFADLTITDVGGDTLIEDGSGNSITLTGIAATDITTDDFIF